MKYEKYDRDGKLKPAGVRRELRKAVRESRAVKEEKQRAIEAEAHKAGQEKIPPTGRRGISFMLSYMASTKPIDDGIMKIINTKH